MEKYLEKILNKGIILVTFFTFFHLFSQEDQYKILDNEIWNLQSDKEKALEKAKEYISLAKKEKNKSKLLNGYTHAVTNSRSSLQLKYSDSLLDVAIQLKNNNQIGNAYNTIGEVLQNDYQYKLALEKTLVALDFYKAANNLHNIYTTKFNLGNIKKYFMDYEESKIWFQESTSYFRSQLALKENSSTVYYLYSLTALIDTNSHLGNFNENKNLLAEGNNFFSTYPDYEQFSPIIISSEGINQYFQKNFSSAIQKLNDALDLYEDSGKHLTERFYLGMSHWHLGDREKAMHWLKMIDEDYNETGKLYPEFRPAYDKIIEYYKGKNQKDSAYYYTEKALAIDRDLNKAMSEVRTKMHKEFDTPRLLEEQEKRSQIHLILIFSVLILGGFGYWLYRKKAKSNKLNILLTNPQFKNIRSEELEALPKSVKEAEAIEKTESTDESIDDNIDYEAYKPINKETVNQILKQLQNFEDHKEFIQPGLKLWSLAKSFNINEKYLSAIIKTKTGFSFNEYLSHLRTQHFTELAEKGEYANKTIEEIAKTLGFANKQMFFREFKARYRMTPGAYLDKYR